MRAIAAMTLMGLLAQGCIIYEERYHRHKGDPDGDGIESPTEPTTPGVEPTEPEPTVTAELFLTVEAALPGDTLLSTLESAGDAIDLRDVTAIEFGRDVQVLDRITRDHEIVLLLDVAGDALPGAVDVFVDTAPGDAWILQTPFTILDPAVGTDTGTDGGSTGTDGGGSTGTGTDGGGTDTGCECTCP